MLSFRLLPYKYYREERDGQYLQFQIRINSVRYRVLFQHNVCTFVTKAASKNKAMTLF